MDDKKQPIIVKKIKKGGHGHHGGAWKVAMADFAIAMMAFFMVMWLLGGTTVEQKAAISSYFKNPSLTQGKSHVAAQGQMGPGGSSTSMIKLGGTMELPKGEGQRTLEKSNNRHGDPRNVGRKERRAMQNNAARAAANERMQFSKIANNINQSFEQSSLKNFKDQLLIDMTDDGLRIQIVDKAGRPMFRSGSSRLQRYAEKILNQLGLIINKANSKISITGHTDGKPYTDRIDYTNWELSSDRANSARRAMLDGGMRIHLIGRVVGMGSSILLDKTKPLSHINRRISIVILNAKAIAALKRLEEGQKNALARWNAAQDKKQDSTKTRDMKKINKHRKPVKNVIIRRNRLSSPTQTRNLLSRPNKNSPDNKLLNDKKKRASVNTHNTTNNDSSIPAKYRGRPAVRIAPGTGMPGIKLPPIIDPSLLPKR